jgi:TusA-related sulfurtransferase
MMKSMIQELAQKNDWHYELHEFSCPPPLLAISLAAENATPGVVLRVKNAAAEDEEILDLWLPFNGIGGSSLSHREGDDEYGTYAFAFDAADPAPAIEKIVQDFLSN